MARVLVMRFSALGDVAMIVPVLQQVAEKYPMHQFVVLSRKRMEPLFNKLPGNVSFRGVDLNQYKGLLGLYRLYKELKQENYDLVADLHDVLRTKVLRLFFNLSGITTQHLNVDRKARKQFIVSDVKEQQVTSFAKYVRVFSALGIPICLDTNRKMYLYESVYKGGVGIAPFAAHQGKIYPLNKMKAVVDKFAMQGVDVYLFGAGKTEKEILESWAEENVHVHSMVGKLKDMGEEIAFMDGLDAMITMDSGNMHLASLTRVPVISIWGATHPLGGFMGWGQKYENCIQMEEMTCRPCSIYGNKPCVKGNYPCLNEIKIDRIWERYCALMKEKQTS